MKTEIEHVKVSELREYERNARTHPKKQIEQVARSIQEFGFTNPVLIDGSSMIIAGHGRLLAAKQLDPKYCAVILERMLELGCAIKKEDLVNE